MFLKWVKNFVWFLNVEEKNCFALYLYFILKKKKKNPQSFKEKLQIHLGHCTQIHTPITTNQQNNCKSIYHKTLTTSLVK